MQSANDNVVVPLNYVIAARALRQLPSEVRRDVLQNAVDLAKQPGLLYRLQAMLSE
ncbi:MAG: hypothetical protein R3E44_16155 [Paracoccaceae bacterium]